MSGCTVRFFWVTVPKIKKGKKRKSDSLDGEGKSVPGTDGMGESKSVDGGSSQDKRYYGGGSQEGNEVEKVQSGSTSPPASNL